MPGAHTHTQPHAHTIFFTQIKSCLQTVLHLLSHLLCQRSFQVSPGGTTLSCPMAEQFVFWLCQCDQLPSDKSLFLMFLQSSSKYPSLYVFEMRDQALKTKPRAFAFVRGIIQLGFTRSLSIYASACFSVSLLALGFIQFSFLLV